MPTFTYTPGVDDRSTVRFLIPDTGPTVWLFQDAELDMLLLLEGGNIFRAAAAAVSGLTGSKAQTLYNFRTDDFSENQGDIVKSLAAYAQSLRDRADQQLIVTTVNGSFDLLDTIRPETVFGELQPGEH